MRHMRYMLPGARRAAYGDTVGLRALPVRLKCGRDDTIGARFSTRGWCAVFDALRLFLSSAGRIGTFGSAPRRRLPIRHDLRDFSLVASFALPTAVRSQQVMTRTKDSRRHGSLRCVSTPSR